MALNILKYTGQPPATKSYPTPYAESREVKRFCSNQKRKEVNDRVE